MPPLLHDVSGAGRKRGRNKIINYSIVNLNGNMLGKTSTQAMKKLYFREGRTVYLPFHIKFNEEKGQIYSVKC